MKRFLSTFLAVLLALVVGFVGLRFLHSVEAWEAEKADTLKELGNFQVMIADSQRDLAEKYAPNPADSPDDASAKAARATEERSTMEHDSARLFYQEQTLLDLYQRKPLPLSGEEKRQAVQWGQDVAGYKAAHP